VAARPLLAVFHEKSSVVTILKETQAGEVIEFGASRPVSATVEDIAGQLRNLLALPPNSRPPTRWGIFERYTAKAMTGRLAAVFDRVASQDRSRLR
jgi:hypothetical protein